MRNYWINVSFIKIEDDSDYEQTFYKTANIILISFIIFLIYLIDKFYNFFFVKKTFFILNEKLLSYYISYLLFFIFFLSYYVYLSIKSNKRKEAWYISKYELLSKLNNYSYIELLKNKNKYTDLAAIRKINKLKDADLYRAQALFYKLNKQKERRIINEYRKRI